MNIEYFDDGDLACFDGLSFRLDKRTGYYLNAKTHKRLHVYVWEYHCGAVPQGHEVHHKDFNKANNEFWNLQLLATEEHRKLHAAALTEAQHDWRRKNLEENARPEAAKWHGSSDGRNWHKAHYESMKDKLHRPMTFVCQNCGKEFKSTQINSKYCSNNCRAAARRRSGVDNVIRVCERCGGNYEANKYRETHYCKSCRSSVGWERRRLQYGGLGDT